jgi:hypothetical protein
MVKPGSARLTAVLVCISATMFAQEPSGAISGSVMDPSGATVPQAVVTAKDQRTDPGYNAHTGDQGTFTFPALPAGEYSVRIDAEGFAPYGLSRVYVEIDRTVRVQVELVISGRQSWTCPPRPRLWRSRQAVWVRPSRSSKSWTCLSMAGTSLSSACCRPVSYR